MSCQRHPAQRDTSLYLLSLFMNIRYIKSSLKIKVNLYCIVPTNGVELFICDTQGKEVSLKAQTVSKAEHYFSRSDVEFSMRSCPELLKKELELFFPTLPMSPITVVTVTQKNAKTDVEDAERTQEQLLDNFVSGAKEICFTLWRGGYWADFINPMSGKAFFGDQTQDSILQDDVRRHAGGFHIEDLASCTLIRHVLKGPPTFVLTLITNAPFNSLIMEKLQGHSKASEEGD